MDTRKKEPYDLEERTFLFAQKVRSFVKTLPKTIANNEDIKQVVRSSGSVGANYIEAQEYTGVKDRVHRIKISRKEAKESKFWLFLLDTGENAEKDKERERLAREAGELTLIFGAIARKIE
ncbi:MAG: four helix bundle protein [Candidatus Taylorbacteria bacterium CG11_big_fil_rev_8_21_14_0_20_46_11]|uniref:Four helix bundle protein n=1 Tax=Candidatus Taylorbacteria bacterium CG11_big_fil_rev_8_21_14_0_20_46_11 TaxID=1975025 RepID=A0A2H0KCM5_9BACT|nr:MAG: four helix bundle protein [Candidatus Taylorbacteria bacterium CG11_big_fil_rev_8_21_14_0_20_46_11]